MKYSGIIQTISFKEGQGKHGPWTKVGLKMDDGNWYGFFQDKSGYGSNFVEGMKVDFEYEVDGKFRNISIPGKEKKSSPATIDLTEINIKLDKIISILSNEKPKPMLEDYNEDIPIPELQPLEDVPF